VPGGRPGLPPPRVGGGAPAAPAGGGGGPPPPPDPRLLPGLAARTPGASLDEFADLLDHLGQVHPSRYQSLLDGVRAVYLRQVATVSDQAAALRLVVLADRLYDRDLPVVASGVAFDSLFSAELLRGGYRKKYLRAVSRLVALARAGARRSGPQSGPQTRHALTGPETVLPSATSAAPKT
jgi:hypothetical protein